MERGEESVQAQSSQTPTSGSVHRFILAGLAVFVGAGSVYWGWVRLAAGSQVEVGIGLVVFGIVLAVAAVGLVKMTRWSFWMAMVGGLGIAGSFLWALLVLGGEPILISVVIVAAIMPVYLMAVRGSFGIGS